MKRLIIKITTLIIILFSLNGKVYPQEKKFCQEKKIGFDIPIEEKFPSVKILKDVLETKKRMKEIEKETIQNDPELKKDFEQLILLKKQMYEKLNEKLKDNEEYNEMKKRLEGIEKKIKERIIEERR